MRLVLWSNHDDLLTLGFPIMFVIYIRPYMGLSKPLDVFLLQNGFSCTCADTTLFLYMHDSCIIYLLIYVDDYILKGNQESVITSFISRLHNEFNSFLEIEVAYTNDDIFLSQSKYVHDIRDHANILDTKPIRAPLAHHESFTMPRVPFKDPTLYRSLLRALQYLTITRSTFHIQFLEAPTVSHFQGVKRILRYVKGVLSFGLHFTKPNTSSIIGYLDVD
uniref:Reverse transcriptase Ty1/copia-type domain-containing protein n=1 Tax=Lactuca sativa TaxID=4236 RepID=A0A9R1XGV1_LACSA|nr:hypothetical protein LSAT_V11C400193830 [Lactuca sativa]